VLARHASSIDYQVEIVDETLLGESDRASIARLLAEAFTDHAEEYQTRGWRTIQPSFRILARSRGEIVGQMSVFEIPMDSPGRVFGLGDMGVRSDCRRRGIARCLCDRAVGECWQRGADILLTDTAALRRVFIALGFTPVPRFAFYYERDGQCRWHPLWLAAVRTTVPRPRLRLAEGDF
jgi:predicted N-acetyltransferase YhbS